MEVLIALAASVALAFLLRKQIKRYAVAFYIIAIAVDILFLSKLLLDVSRDFAVVVYPYLTRCLVGFALFSLVMYIGVLPSSSKARHILMPIRGELSIIAAILTIGHVANYLGTYFSQILSGFVGMSAGMIASFVLSSLLIVLLTALTVTSFNTIKARMRPDIWKNLQRTAYLFYGLTYLHLVLVLAPAVSSTGQRAALSIAVYSVVVGIYFILRLIAHFRKTKQDAAAS
ncbi:MAG: hypothetical protein RSB04_12025 [Gordonibacter sp.]|uniref:hypothetical protein n=1 Tax=Gordonibacter sp. TaxID=1968902 RepID=UPI002FCC0305